MSACSYVKLGLNWSLRSVRSELHDLQSQDWNGWKAAFLGNFIYLSQLLLQLSMEPIIYESCIGHKDGLESCKAHDRPLGRKWCRWYRVQAVASVCRLDQVAFRHVEWDRVGIEVSSIGNGNQSRVGTLDSNEEFEEGCRRTLLRLSRKHVSMHEHKSIISRRKVSWKPFYKVHGSYIWTYPLNALPHSIWDWNRRSLQVSWIL